MKASALILISALILATSPVEPLDPPEWTCSCDSVAQQPQTVCATSPNRSSCLLNQTVSIDCVGASCGCSCTVQGSLEIAESSGILCDATSLCYLNLNVEGNVTSHPGSVIKASTVRIVASDSIFLQPGSVVNSSGLGLLYRPESSSKSKGMGGSHGGFGGRAKCSDTYSMRKRQFGNPVLVWNHWLDPREESNSHGFGFGANEEAILPILQPLGGRGGGRIAIIAQKNILVRGLVLADGSHAEQNCEENCGSGAGGTIFLNASVIKDSEIYTSRNQTAFPAPRLSAVGGDATFANNGAGGGGRIGIFAVQSILLQNDFVIQVYGGTGNDGPVIASSRTERKKPSVKEPSPTCSAGGAGSIVRAVFSAEMGKYVTSLQITNCPLGSACSRLDFVMSPSPLVYPFTESSRGIPSSPSSEDILLKSLDISKFATVNASSIVLVDLPALGRPKLPKGSLGLTLDNARLKIWKEIISPGLELRSGSSLSTSDGPTYLKSSGPFILDATSDIGFRGKLGISVSNFANVSGPIRSDKDGSGSHLHLFAESLEILGSGIVSDKISIVSDYQVEVSSKLTASFSADCAQFESRSLCNDFNEHGIQEYREPPWMSPVEDDKLTNYSLVIIVKRNTSDQPSAMLRPPSSVLITPHPRRRFSVRNVTLRNDLILHQGADVTARSIMLCSDFMKISGKVQSSGQGCRADSGPGPGCHSSTPGGAGGGGGHGGLGGAGIGCYDRGKTYDSKSLPMLSGSGGGGSGPSMIGGGSGGGVVLIGSSQVLHFEGHVLCDGLSGNSQMGEDLSAGGGGAGGSIIFASPSICTSASAKPVLSARGGNGGEGGGGGGGGGRVSITYTDELLQRWRDESVDLESIRFVLPPGASCTHFGNFSAKVLVDGGKEGGPMMGAESSSIDLLAFKSKEGRRGGASGTVSSPKCSPGHGGSWCAVCDFGFYKETMGAEPCERCNHRTCIQDKTCVWMAEGGTQSDCPVICNPGYVLPNCVSPLENLIASMGGIVVFASVIAAFGLTMVIVFTCVCTRVEWCPGYYANEAKMMRKRLRTARALREHRRQLGFMDDDDDGSVGASRNVPLLHGIAEERDAGSEGGLSGFTNSPGAASVRAMGGERDIEGEYSEFLPLRNDRAQRAVQKRRNRLGKRKESSSNVQRMDRLLEGDIPFHLTRVYFSGDNSPERPWHMPETVPSCLQERNFFDAAKYAKMARAVNELAKHSTASWLIRTMLWVLCYPLGYLYTRRQRNIRAYKLLEFFETYDHECVNHTRARSLMNTFKFGKDKNSTLCYVDILSSKPVEKSQQEARLPMLLFLSGDGSYWDPFYVDWSDMLVRAVPQLVELRTFIDQAWADMIMLHLNAALRQVDPNMLESTAQMAIRVVDKYSNHPQDLLGGLRVRLGLFEAPGENVDESTFEHDGKRLALLLTRADAFPSSGRATPVSFPRSTEMGEGVELETEEGVFPDEADLMSHSGSSHSGPRPSSSLISKMLSHDEKRVGVAAVAAFEQEERKRSGTYANSELTRSFSNEINDAGEQVLPGSPSSRRQSTSKPKSPTQSSYHLFDGGVADSGSSPRRKASLTQPRTNSKSIKSALTVSGNSSSPRPPSSRSGAGTFNWSGEAVQSAEVDLSFQTNPDLSVWTSDLELETAPFVGRVLVRKRSDEDFDMFPLDNLDGHGSLEEIEAEQASPRWWWVPTYHALAALLSYVRQSLGILVNRTPRRGDRQLFSRAYLSCLLAVDVACTFFLLTTFFCVDHKGKQCIRTLFVLVMGVYPFALVVGPLLGLTFIVFPLSGMGRQYAVWNVFSILNAVTCCILCIVYREKFSFQAGLFSAILLLAKLLQSRAVDWYIALVELDRGRRKQRN